MLKSPLSIQGVSEGRTIALSSSKKASLNLGEAGAYTLVMKKERLERVDAR
jgi:hypothetical protein